MALVVALSNGVVGVEKAEAAGHVHEEETIILTAREGGYEHYVKFYDWYLGPEMHSYSGCPVG